MLQLQYLNRNNIEFNLNNHGLSWSSSIIRLIWEHCYEEWKVRNQAKHGRDADTRAQARLEKAHRDVRALYDIKPKCFHRAQRQYFYPSFDAHIAKEKDVRNLENWVVTYKPMILQDAKRRQEMLHRGQRPIDDFFRPVGNTPPSTSSQQILPH
jgi:hypothetical protein